MKKISLIIIYFILIIYTIETLLFLFTPQRIYSMNDLKNKRIEIAKQKGLEFDTRSPKEAFLEISKNDNQQCKQYVIPKTKNIREVCLHPLSNVRVTKSASNIGRSKHDCLSKNDRHYA